MRINLKSRRVKHGTVSVVLTAVVVAAIVILNVILSVLAGRYDGLYIDMSAERSFAVTEECKEYLAEYVFPEMADDGSRITILFCEEEENITDDPSLLTLSYIRDSALEIADAFPGKVDIEYLNVWEQPSRARGYGVTGSTDIVIIYKDSYERFSLRDFYIFSVSDSTIPLAYNGEKRIATGMMRVVQPDIPMCYLTVNHGELVEDYELMYMLADAGYNYAYLDLFNYGIPDDCELLVTFNPAQDLASEGELSKVSESDKIREYMNNGGKYMVFVSADTFVSGGHENFEALLAEWGVEFMHTSDAEGIENCYNIKDTSHSTSTDGYTVLSRIAQSGFASEFLSDISKPCVFGGTTCIGVPDGFLPDGNGNFAAEVNGARRETAPLMVSYDSAEAWAGGRVVAKANEQPFTLMSLSRQTCENGETSYLLACASTAFASEDAMQSVVFGNNGALSSVLKAMGKDNVATELGFKPFGDAVIESITTSQATAITLTLAIAPAVIAVAVGTALLVKRKNR